MTVMGYRTRDGLADYGFSIDYQPGIGWRVYIVFQPFDRDNDDKQQLPYQAIDRDGRRYVDWSERLDNLGDAKAVAVLWAEVIQGYRRDQERCARYVELIERCLRDHERRRATLAGPDHRGEDAVDGGAADPGQRDRGSVTTYPGAPTESLSDLQESA